MVTNYRNHGASYSNNILTTALIMVYFEFELITGQAAMADLSRGTAQVYNYMVLRLAIAN